MSHVISLRGDQPVIPDQPVAEVLDLLRRTLAEAERGEIVGIALGVVRPTGRIATEWVEPGGFKHQVVVAVATLSARVGASLIED